MSEDKQPDKDKKPELPPGWYDSPFDQHPGQIQFPYPLTYPQWKKWWKAAVEPLKEHKALDFAHWDSIWQGSKILILEYGSWDIANVKKGEAEDDNVPLIIEEWVVSCGRAYIFPQLDPKKRQMLSTLM